VNDVVERYLLLGLRLGRHVEGFVDAYYGPSALKERVEAEPPVPPADLAREAGVLIQELDELADDRRARWLAAQLDGLAATAERLDGARLAFTDEVRRCYGVELRPPAEDELNRAHQLLDELLPGVDPLPHRYRAWREDRLSEEALLSSVERLRLELRTRTEALFGLPAGESVDVHLVSNEPWAGFNYYLGNRRSRVVLNTDVLPRPDRLPEYAAHEIYPGHHTEHAWKETVLVDGDGRLEESIFLTGTPQSLISEGIATNAMTALGPEAAAACAEIMAEAGAPYHLELVEAVYEAEEPVRRLSHTIALMLHADSRSREETRELALRWSLRPENEVDKALEFGLHPAWRSYVVVYEAGERLVRDWVAGDPARFRRLLTDQLTTADLLQQV
jgi:hypothetical protein